MEKISIITYVIDTVQDFFDFANFEEVVHNFGRSDDDMI